MMACFFFYEVGERLELAEWEKDEDTIVGNVVEV